MSESVRRGEPPGQLAAADLVVCLRNTGCEALLVRGRRYQALPDEKAAEHDQLRIVDESGEDYLYPRSWFGRRLTPVSPVES